MAIAEAYNSGEDEEEEAGFMVPPHNPLEDNEKPKLPAELQAAQERIEKIFDFYSSTLANSPDCLRSNYTPYEFYAIWDDLANETTIISHMEETSPRITITLKDNLAQKENVCQNDYNLKLVLNIIGLMREPGIVTKTTEELNSMFFTDVKTKYFKLNEIEKVGTTDSGIKDEAMLELIRTIIRQHTKQSGTAPDTSPILPR